MKKVVLLGISLVNIITIIFAQNEEDALRYSQNFYGGTARFFSMGSSISPFAADNSAIGINPASLGKYKGSEITITPLFTYNKTSSSYLDGTLDDYRFHFQIGNLGIVLTHNNGEENNWKSVSFAFAYNRLNDFARYIKIEGYNTNTSMTDYFAALANGKKTDEFDGFNEGLAWEAYLIDPDTSGNYKYISALPNYGTRQITNISTRGGMGEYIFAIAGNYKNSLYMGMSLGIQSIRYNNITNYSEIDEKDTIPSFNYFNFDKELKTTGSGFNFKFGLIYNPVPWVRLGMAFHTPTFFNLSDKYKSSIQSSFNDTLHGDGKIIHSKLGLYDYELTTPFKAIGSIGFVLYDNSETKMPKVSISLEYEFIDYTMARLRADDYTFRNENNIIENAYRSTGNFRGGIEYRIDELFIRAGYALYQSPYSSNTSNSGASRSIYSLGFGIKGDNTYFDLGLFYAKEKVNYFIWDPSVVSIAPAKLTYNQFGLTATLGFRF